jgi:hypothetical protein
MAPLKISAVVALTFLVSSCVGVTVNQDFNPSTNFSSLTTWDWIPEGNRQGDETRTGNPLVDQRVRDAIENQMAAKGFRKVDSGDPSFRVGYHLILDDRVDYQTVNTYYGGGWGYRGVYGRYGGPGYGASRTYATEYTMGTIIIDFFDVGSKELVWRGSGEGKVHESTTPQERQQRAGDAVRLILDQFPPTG